jgi:orotidine-5'-phosphate decarboxylase
MATHDRSELSKLSPRERLIVALDVPTADEALALVRELNGLVSFFKVGTELLMSGEMGNLLVHLTKDKKVFVDLKMQGDIPETVRRTVDVAAKMGVTFLTLSYLATRGTIQTAVAARGGRGVPQILSVSFLSSLDRSDFTEQTGRDASEFEAYLEQRTSIAIGSGADGFIVSGPEIGLLRGRYPEAILVSPGIRPSGTSTDDHKRSCTPAEAIRLGADYIVVGRPIRNAPDRRDAAERIVGEIASAIPGSAPHSHSVGNGQSSDGAVNGGRLATEYGAS